MLFEVAAGESRHTIGRRQVQHFAEKTKSSTASPCCRQTIVVSQQVPATRRLPPEREAYYHTLDLSLSPEDEKGVLTAQEVITMEA